MINDQTRQHRFCGYTLVDITNTGVTQVSDTEIMQRNQQRNWETILQVVGLRTQILQSSQQLHIKKLELFEFGELYRGRHNIWEFMFTVEFSNVYYQNNSPVGGLIADVDQTPIIPNLTETATFPLPIFCTQGPSKNIYFKFISI